MFKDEFLEEILIDEEVRKCPVGCQSTIIHVFEDKLTNIAKENPYATISELLQQPVL